MGAPDARLHALIAAAMRAWRPPPKLSLSEWADTHAVLSEESSAEGGRWHCLPYQRGMLDAITDPAVTEVWVMKSARVGYTKCLNHTIGYHIHQDPCPILMVQPTIEDAKGYSKEEIAPMLRDTPVLRGVVADSKAKDSDNTIMHKMFPGGVLSLAGANSPRGFRRVSRRVVLFDEVDGYPPSAGAEGDQIKLGIRRSEYYWNRKIVGGSTPTVRDASRIEAQFLSGDQRRYYVPCPHCGEMQVLKWGGKDTPYGIKWPDGEPERAYYVCEHNGCVIQHEEKYDMIARGEWRAHAEFKGKASFHIWAAYSYSPNAKWGQLAVEFLEAKSNPEALKTFVNTVLGETWEEEYTARLNAEGLAERAEPYKVLTVPAGGLALFGSIDVQDNRVEVLLWAVGEGEESWVVNYAQIFGDPEQAEIWAQVDSIIDAAYAHENGHEMRVRAVGIDTGGHHTHAVYVWARNRAARKRRNKALPHVLALKGSSLAGKQAMAGKATRQDIEWKGQVIARGAELWMVGTDTIKTVIYRRLKNGEPGPGCIHFPFGLPGDFYKQLTAERQMPKYKNGFQVRVWVKKAGDRNEALDLMVYAYAVFQWWLNRVNKATIWAQLQKLLAPVARVETPEVTENTVPAEPPKPVTVIPRKPLPQRKRGGFITGWRR